MQRETPRPATPRSQPENIGLAFIGEAAWASAVISEKQAASLTAARNAAGRPNSDVLRSFIGKTGPRVRQHWQIDFPAHYHEQEAALHEKPFTLLKKATGERTASPVGLTVGASLLATQHPRSREQARTHSLENKEASSSGTWWLNPHAQPTLRHALARLDRFLATALDSPEPSWSWFESEHLPDASLLVVARDDDFTHAVLQSAAFTAWWRAHARKTSPIQVIESFPFPWPPFTPLGSLTKAQQDLRSQGAHAALAGDTERIDSAIAAAYGWTECLEVGATLDRLRQLAH